MFDKIPTDIINFLRQDKFILKCKRRLTGLVKAEQHFLDLNQWYDSPLGKLVANDVEEQLSQILPNFLGYHIVQIGMETQKSWFGTSPIAHKIYVSDQLSSQNADVFSRFHILPFATASVDVVFLPHTLGFCSEPERLIREIDRILIPEGHFIILGFNAFSWWGLAKALFSSSHEAPWVGRYFSSVRIGHFLRHHGYEVDAITEFFYRPPLKNPQTLQRLAFLETVGRLVWPYPGGLYLLHAKKHTNTMTRIKPIWQFRNIVVGKRYIQPIT